MELLSVPTILTCMFLSLTAASVAMAIVWLHNHKERAAGYWALAFLMGALGCISIAFRHVMIEYLEYAIAIHTVFVLSSFLLVWTGFRAFNGQSVPFWSIAGTLAGWLALYAVWEPLRTDANVGIAVQSAIAAVLSLLAAHTVYFGPGNRRLPMAFPAALFLTTHAVMHVLHIGYAVFDPSPIVEGRVVATWWKFFMLEAFIHTILTAISCVILIKDRSEEQHRIASETDMLTGIANRRAFVMETEKALKNAAPDAVLAIIDIDHFKQINDRFGHTAGDQALIAFTRTVAEALPQGANFGRMGGEEFAVFLPTTLNDPTTTLEDVRRRIEETVITHLGTPIPLTVSIGVATVNTAGPGFDQLVAAADCALYIAKDEGRNRLNVFSQAQRLRKISETDGEKRVGLANERVSRRAARSKIELKAS